MPTHHGAGRGKLIIAVAAVVVIAAASFLFFGSGGVTYISQSAELHLTNSTTLFNTGSGEYMIYVAQGSSATSPTVYISRLPALLNPLLQVSLSAGNMTRVNVGTTYANLGITLNSAGKNSADVTLTVLDPSLQIAPDSGSISLVPAELGQQTTQGVLGATSPNITTTTVPQSLLSQSSTTSVATTTISQANLSYGRAITAWHASKFYGLMANYTTMYQNTAECTPSTYNSTFIQLYGYAPQATGGAATFQNASINVPDGLYSNVTNAGSGNYYITYYTKAPSGSAFNNAKALVLTVNASNEQILNSNYTGVFQDQSYASILQGYQEAVKLGGACGIEVG